MSRLTLNIETIGDPTLPPELLPNIDEYEAPSNYKDQQKIAEYKLNAMRGDVGKFSLSPLTGKIICASWQYTDTNGASEVIQTIIDENESEILKGIASAIISHQHEFPVIVTYNGISFDIPFIVTGFARHNVPVPPHFTARDLLNKYGTDHIDVYAYLSSFGVNKRGTLTDWSARFGIELPYGKGSMIADWYRLGEWDSIRKHCESNVRCTDALYVRLKQADFFGPLNG